MTPDPQQVLDAEGQYIVRGLVQPPAPLFLSPGQSLLGGDAYAKWDSYQSGFAALAGWRRGLIDDSHFPAGGFRTNGDSFLLARGTEWDMGPLAGGWGSVNRLKVVFTATKNFAGSWDGHVLAGLNNPQGGYGVRPAPWVLYIEGGLVKLALTTANGTLHTETQTVDLNAAVLDVTFDLDLVALYGAGTTLKPNVLWPFGVFRAPPGAVDSGYWGAEGTPPDITLTRLEVHTNGALLCQFSPTRCPTYTGGPSLPLVSGQTTGGGKWLLAVHTSQGVADSGGGLVAGLELAGRAGNPVVGIGSILGGQGLTIRDAKLSGGTRAIQSLCLSVAYPLTVTDSLATGQSDAALWLRMTSGCTLDRLRMDYSLRTCAEFISCNAWIRGELMLAPPGPPAQEAVFIQHGGRCYYERIVSDYEYTPGPDAFLKLYPDSADNPTDPTQARLDGCVLPVGNLVDQQSAAPGYTGVVTVTTEV